MRSLLLSVLLLSATTAGCTSSSSYDSPEDCMALDAGDARDECWSLQAVPLFKQNEDDPTAAEKIINEQVSSSQIRDFIWLDVTKRVSPQSRYYCQKIETSALRERCATLVSRPHLHRELLQGEGGAPGPGGGPPSKGKGKSKGPGKAPPPGGGPGGGGPGGGGPGGGGPGGAPPPPR